MPDSLITGLLRPSFCATYFMCRWGKKCLGTPIPRSNWTQHCEDCLAIGLQWTYEL